MRTWFLLQLFLLAVSNENQTSRSAGTSSSIGGMASSLVPDTTVDPEKQQQQHNPLLSALRPGPAGTPVAALQFESNSGLLDELEDSDEDMPRTGEKRSGRRKIKIEYIDDKSRRHITFSKRKAGIMKKVHFYFCSDIL